MSSLAVWAVTMMIGTIDIARNARQTSYPDMSGSRRSSRTRSGSLVWNAANPDDPATEATAQLGSGSRSSGVLRGAIVGALIGAIVGLSVWLLKRRNAG